MTGLASFTNFSTPVTFRLYGWNAEAAGGTFSIDNVKFSGSAAISASAPNIILSNSFINFPSTARDESSVKTYTVSGSNLAGPLTITATSPYAISDALNGTYSTSLTIPASDISAEKTIYVKFSPSSARTFSGTITHSSQSASDQTITLTGDGIDANNLSFNFDNCSSAGTPGSGFLSYSVTGAQKWACSTFGRNNTNGVDINGYSGGAVENEDWLISPPLLISSLNLPILSFWSRGEFSGPGLKVLVSSNYDGSSDPDSATWTDMNANFPALTNTWTLTDGIDLSAYKSFSKVYIAFKYTSSDELGAARWTLDDVSVANITTLITVNPTMLSFGEAPVGTNTGGLPFIVKAAGYGDITLAAPAGYQLSADSAAYTNSITISSQAAQAGAKVFARFSPVVRALKIEGLVRITGTGLDSMNVDLTGTSYLKAETFDAGCYNLSFFGSNSTNNPTQDKISTQITNIATVIQKLNLDVIGVEEVSNDTAFTNLLKRLPNRSAVISDRWSYSFNGPDSTFPPQKTGFIYDTTTTRLVEVRDMFESLYDSARNGYPEKLPDYPGGTPSSFWASGRLPFMATFDATSGGVTKRIRVIDIHAKSASDPSSFNRRLYDAKVLKDSLDAYYATDNIIIVGDFNDRLAGSIYISSPASPYKPFVDDSTDYASLTYPLDVAGKVSFVSGTGLIDQIVTSNELKPFYLPNSADIDDPRSYISNYGANTASDHLPVYSRFSFSSTLPVILTKFNAIANGSQVLVIWNTATEFNNHYFVIERSADGAGFSDIGELAGFKIKNGQAYQFVDEHPLKGISYYRLKQVDNDGKFTFSNIVPVNFTASVSSVLSVYPNPVINSIKINISSASAVKDFTVKVIAGDGSLRIQVKGDINQINQQVNHKLNGLAVGVYILTMGNSSEKHVLKFIKQ